MFAQEARDNPMFAQEARDDPMVASECGCKAAVLRIGLTLGTVTCLVAWECEKRWWFTCKGRHNYPLVVILEHVECPWGRG
ncbi:hypothetical protein CDL15_Pgr016492 [Punica granatum]|uniref:Uncharacterized protein n=1 Tax=Punica granatum TaxID=22663 RepID=A0A218WVL7_PUNGR|nr:hypothetical protein CDL15_Pgr016492 [Punica granatum]